MSDKEKESKKRKVKKKRKKGAASELLQFCLPSNPAVL
jgi:hypothetical protein